MEEPFRGTCSDPDRVRKRDSYGTIAVSRNLSGTIAVSRIPLWATVDSGYPQTRVSIRVPASISDSTVDHPTVDGTGAD